jgi:hypothetical protein
MIVEGVKYDRETNCFEFNFEHDGLTDIIKIKEIPIHESTFMDNLYLYGYKFEDGIEGSIRSEFIKELKTLTSKKILDKDMFNFISNAVSNLHKKINIATFEYLVYPETKGSIMNKFMRRIYDYTAPKFNTIELIKESAANIEFDYDAFYQYSEDKNYNKNDKKKIVEYIEKVLNDVKTYNYFSIANAVKKPKYRPFFKHFLKFKTEKDKIMFEKLQNTNVLIVDDINTSGSTLRECLRVLDSINPNNKKVLFTIMGNNYETL